MGTIERLAVAALFVLAASSGMAQQQVITFPKPVPPEGFTQLQGRLIVGDDGLKLLTFDGLMSLDPAIAVAESHSIPLTKSRPVDVIGKIGSDGVMHAYSIWVGKAALVPPNPSK